MAEKPINSIEPEPIPEGTDMEVVLFLIDHLEHPCGVEVAAGQVKDIRGFYIREARSLLLRLTNPFAKEMLEEKLKEYEGK